MSLITNLMAKLSVKPLLIACGVLVLACAALTTTLLISNAAHDAAMARMEGRADKLSAQLSSAQDSAAALYTANQSQTQAIRELQQRLSDAVGQEQRTAEVLQSTTAQRDAERTARQRAETALRAQRDQTYATDSTCAAWGRAPVCAAISDSLRQQWEETRATASGGNGGGGSAQAPAGAHPAAPDRSSPFASRPDPRHPVWGSGVPAADGLLQRQAIGGDAIFRAGMGAGSGR